MPRKPRGAITPIIKPREVKPMATIEAPFLACPLCSMSRKLDKSVKGRVHFGTFDLENSYLIQLRNCSGSRGSGFPTIGGYTIEELKGKPEFKGLLDELGKTCRAILEKLGG